MSEGDTSSAGPRDGTGRAVLFCFPSRSLVILCGVLLLGSHYNNINKPPKPSEAARLTATTPMSLFYVAKMKKNTLMTRSANYLQNDLNNLPVSLWLHFSRPARTYCINSQRSSGRQSHNRLLCSLIIVIQTKQRFVVYWCPSSPCFFQINCYTLISRALPTL